jgi:class 3 adenylate cyclase/tetratricopeptide (TPR) repeat protein
MKCPECGFENVYKAKFCVECGTRMEVQCANCKTSNLVGNKFCFECGHSLAAPAPPKSPDLSFDEKISEIQRYLPEGLTEKILSQRARIEGEKKQVTVMFCDMKGFTPLSEELGPEEMYTLMDQVYEILIHKVNDYGGTVNELTGDGIMALFGAPVALEDAPQRAIRSALAVHREITRFSERMKREKEIPAIRMRIGIHSGPVVVGTLGNDLRVDFKAVGDTVNLASRMENMAEPGTTYVTEDTFKLTEGLFRFESLGEKGVKGKEGPIKVYQIIAPSARRTRFDVSAERGLTAFVGRDRELELLLDGFERAKEGTGQAFSIIGEAGIGKSRFLYEFRKAVSTEDMTFLEGKCLSFGKGIPYHPISDVLKDNFDIREDDSDDPIRKKVMRSLGVLKVEETTTLPYLLELLAVKDSGIDRIPMSPEGKREKIIEAVKQIIFKGAQIRPFVVAIEDLHWADKSTEEALKRLLEAIPVARVLLIFTYRPEFVHTWGGRSFHNQITLNRLSNRESLLMVSHVLDSSAVDPELERLILSKTEGVPFFIEEFVKSLRDLGVIKREDGKVFLTGDPQSVSIPSTIQDMIMARVDRLPDGAKAVLQAGSVIEREFPHDLISTVTDLPETELLGHLSALKDSELLYERGIYPKTSYIFRHVLTREVVYASILTRRCKELHNKIALVIEELHKDDLAGDYEVLAEHFFQAEDYAKAAGYSRRSARKAERSVSLPDAIAHARKRVLCLEKLPDSGERAKELIDARTFLGLYLNQIDHWAEAGNAVEPIFQMAREKASRKRLGQIQALMGCYYGFVEEDFPKAFHALEESLQMAGEEKDMITMILTNLWLGILCALDCNFEKTRKSIQRSLNINIAAKSLWGIAAMKAQLAYFGHFWAGKINSLSELSLEALNTAEESGDPISRGMSHTTYGVACYAKGKMKDAEYHILQGKNLHERIGMYGWAGLGNMSLAETYFEMKEYQKSGDCYDRAVQIYEVSHAMPSSTRMARLGMTRCRVMLGKRDVDLGFLRSIAESKRIRLFDGWNSMFLGDILQNIGGSYIVEAEHWMRKAIEAHAGNGVRFELGLDHALYGEYFKRQGKMSKAQEELGKAIEILRECGADGWVEKYERELSALQ